MPDTETGTKRNVHPKVAARAFKVHLRTVFRWVKRGNLITQGGRIDRVQALEYLKVWNLTLSAPEARRKLQVMPATLLSWQRKGFLDAVEVLGTKRYYKLSIERILALPNYQPGAERVLFNASLREVFSAMQDEAIVENTKWDNQKLWEKEKAKWGLTYERRVRPTSHLPEPAYTRIGFAR